MADNTTDNISDKSSILSDDDVVPEDLEQLWKEAMDQCEQVEKTHTEILFQMATIQPVLSDQIMVCYQGEIKELGDVLDTIHQQVIEQTNQNVGSLLRSMLETCEFTSLNMT